jgi:hypothetical protein
VVGVLTSSPATPDYPFREDERPAMPGGPFVPRHSRGRKVGYAVTGLTIALLGTFANNLVSTNLAAIAGDYGLYQAEATWLTVAFTGMSASASLFVIKGRQQFGIDRIIKALLGLYLATALLQLLVPDFATAMLTRAANGLVTSTATAMAVYYVLEILPPRARPLAVVIVIGCSQISAPLARMVPVELLTEHINHGQHLFDVAVPLVELALILAWPLPPTPTSNVFERADVLTVALLLPALLLLVAVLGLGRVRWWVDTPWLGWLLVFAVPLLAGGILLELSRRRPALWIGWMTHGDMLRFAAVSFVERIALAEQSVGAVGLLSSAGLNNDQLHGLFGVVALAMLAGIATAALTLSQKTIPFQIVAALLIIGGAAWLDGFSGGETRIRELMLSQAMIGFGTTLFVGPALLFGILRVIEAGPQMLLSMVMVFGFTQNIGALTGNALLASLQYGFAQDHAQTLVAGLPDPVALAGVGGQATILATLDIFRLVAGVSVIAALFVAIAALRARFTERRS